MGNDTSEDEEDGDDNDEGGDDDGDSKSSTNSSHSSGSGTNDPARQQLDFDGNDAATGDEDGNDFGSVDFKPGTQAALQDDSTSPATPSTAMTLLEDLAKDLATLADNPFQDLDESYISPTPPHVPTAPTPHTQSSKGSGRTPLGTLTQCTTTRK